MSWNFWEKKNAKKPLKDEGFDQCTQQLEEYIKLYADPLTIIPGKINIYSGTWRYIKAFCANRIQSLRCQNDSINLDSHKTAAIRGEIQALKMLIALENYQERNEPKAGYQAIDDRDLEGI